METNDLSEEAELLAKKEVWAQQIAGRVTEQTGVDLETALAGAHWASLWVDDLNVLMARGAPDSKDGLKELVRQAFKSSLDRAETIPRYPGLGVTEGSPSIKSIIAANEAFCLAFGEDADFARELL